MPGENQASDDHSGGINDERHPRVVIFRRNLKEWQEAGMAGLTVHLGYDTQTPLPCFFLTHTSLGLLTLRLTVKPIDLLNIYCCLILFCKRWWSRRQSRQGVRSDTAPLPCLFSTQHQLLGPHVVTADHALPLADDQGFTWCPCMCKPKVQD